MRCCVPIVAVFAFALLWGHVVVGQQTATGATVCTPGELRTDSTPNCISIEWDVTGDSDHDAECSVQYRENGTEEWKQALPLFRVDYAWWYHTSKAERALNIFAGSILFLKPGTRYQVKLEFVDPDGGEADKVISVATRPIPQLPKGGRTLHVAPGSGKGSGSADDPLRGLAQAEETAKPGDVCLLHHGNYGSYVFQKSGEPGSYIVWKSAGGGDVVFASLQVRASHIWLEGLKLKRQEKTPGLRAGSKCTDIVVRRNRFDGYHYSILLNRDSRYWHITDNVIVGDNDPETGGISGEGIELSHSSGHVVAYNDISGVADGISYPDRNCDIYGNDIHDVSAQHLTLKAACNAIDAGDVLPNINDDFTGKAPDLGAYEFGKPLPQYGPRGED